MNRKFLVSIESCSHMPQKNKKLTISDEPLQDELRFKMLFENMREGFSLNEIIKDDQGRVVDFRVLEANAAYEIHTGLVPADIIGKTAREVAPQLDQQTIELYGKVALTGEPLELEYFASALERYLRVRVFCPKKDYFASIFEDITESRRALDQIAFQARMLNEIQQAVIVADLEGRYTYVNQFAEELFGIQAFQVIGKKVSLNIFDEFDSDQGKHIREQALAKGYWMGELQVNDTNGNHLVLWSSVSLVRDEKDQVTHFLSIHNDITRRKIMENALTSAYIELEHRVQERTAELQEVNIALEKALQTKNEFMAAMSHELRTPLTGILGMAELLMEGSYGSLTEQQSKAATLIDRSGRRLLILVNDLIDYSILQSGDNKLDLQLYSLNDVCNAAIRDISADAEAKGQKTFLKIDSAFTYIRTDYIWMKKLLHYLLKNASKFTSEGGEFGINVSGDSERNQVFLTVWDHGIGIKEEDFPSLFKPFTQLDAKLSREYEGTGLGLTIVGKLVEIYQWEIKVSSIFGQGSQFTLVIPLAVS